MCSPYKSKFYFFSFNYFIRLRVKLNLDGCRKALITPLGWTNPQPLDWNISTHGKGFANQKSQVVNDREYMLVLASSPSIYFELVSALVLWWKLCKIIFILCFFFCLIFICIFFQLWCLYLHKSIANLLAHDAETSGLDWSTKRNSFKQLF